MVNVHLGLTIPNFLSQEVGQIIIGVVAPRRATKIHHHIGCISRWDSTTNPIIRRTKITTHIHPSRGRATNVRQN